MFFVTKNFTLQTSQRLRSVQIGNKYFSVSLNLDYIKCCFSKTQLHEPSLFITSMKSPIGLKKSEFTQCSIQKY